MEYPVYTAGPDSVFIGYHDEEELRPILRRREARLIGVGKSPRVILMKELSSEGAKSLSGSSGGAALRTVCTEQLYEGSKKNGPVVVTHTLLVSKRLVTVRAKGKSPVQEFRPWSERDKFARKRFNPDNIRPQFRSEREFEAARGKNS